MRTWTEYGYGYPLFNGSNLPNIVRFIVENNEGRYSGETIQNMYEATDEFKLYDYTEDPVPWVVAETINNLEGTTVFRGYQDDGDTNQESMIGIEPCYPWTMNSNDPKTKEEANALLNKYAKILGITETPSDFTAEYFG